MAKRSRTAVLKRQREARKAEKQAMKREKREVRDAAPVRNEVVATADDLAGYGFAEDEDQPAESVDPPGPVLALGALAARPTQCATTAQGGPMDGR